MTALPEAAYNIPLPGLRGKYGNQNTGKWRQAALSTRFPCCGASPYRQGRTIEVRYRTLEARAASVFM